MIKAEELRKLLRYDAETGELTWLVTLSNRAQAGTVPKAKDSKGYRVVRIHKKLYRQHRVVWAIVHGCWPDNDIDHIDGVRTNNALANLRVATRSQNHMNRKKPSHNKSGVKGVCWCNTTRRWLATIRVDGKQKYLGVFKDKDKAAAAYANAATNAYGEFARID